MKTEITHISIRSISSTKIGYIVVSLLCNGVYIEALIKAAAASWTSSSSSSSVSMASFSPCGVLLDESCDGKEKRTFEKNCEAADALVQISGMLVDAAQILRDCHKVRRRQIYGHFDALVKPTLTPNAKCKLSS